MNAADPPPPPTPLPRSAVEDATSSSPPAACTARAPSARSLLALWTAQMLVVLTLGLPVLGVAALVAVLHSAAGTAWLLQGLPGLKVERPQGALLGSDFSAERLVLKRPGQGQLEIDGLVWSGARWRWWLSAELWAGVEMDRLSAARVQWRSAPQAPPLQAPPDLRLPLRWRVEQLDLGRVDIDGLNAHALSGRMELGAEDGRVHQWSALNLRSGRVLLSAEVRLVAAPAPSISAHAQARSLQGPDWHARVQADGPLQAVRMSALLHRGSGQAPQDAATSQALLEGDVTLHPFEPWPLGAMSLKLGALDLSTLVEGWPRTGLSGRAEVRTTGLDQAATADIDIGNDRPEAWDRGGLPLRRVSVSLSAVPGQPDAVTFSRADLELGAAGLGAGRLTGSGRWDAKGVELDLRLQELQPQRLHGQASAMNLSGPLRARVTGLSGPAALGRPDSGARRERGASWRSLTVDVQTDLEGVAPALRERVRVALDGSLADGRVEWRQLEATTASTRAQASGLAERDARGSWRTRTQGRLEGFDPARWWPGALEGPWRQGPHALNATWDLDLALPAGARSLPALQWLPSLQGTGSVRLAESLLAGVGLAGRLSFSQGGPGRSAAAVAVNGDFMVGGNRLQVQGEADPSGSGASDRWELSLDARTLRELSPLARLHPALKPWAPRSGRLRAQLSAQGRWPRLVSQGEVETERLEAGRLSVERGEVRWRADSVNRQSGDLRLDLHGTQWGRTRLDTLEARLDGTFGQHRAQLSWQAPIVPPPLAAHLLGLAPDRSSQGRLTVEGGWSARPDGAGRWSGQVRRLFASQAAPANADTRPWLDARDVGAVADFSTGGELSELRIGAGRASLGPSLRLRWDEIGYRLSGTRRDFELDFEVEPTEVAPVLQRARTGLTWTGDLRLGLQGRVRAARELTAEVALRRLGGDLRIGEEGDQQALGLTQVGLTLQIDQGVWRVAPLLAGSRLGTVSGALTLRTPPQDRWPAGGSVLSGAVQAQVNDLSIWSAWVPPGWGLSGQLSTTAGVSGQLDAPEFTGELEARDLGVRNLLQGIAFSDGRARIALRGDRAQIEQFELRGGQGTLRVSGDADIGLQPHGRLRLDARQLTLLGRVDRQLSVSGDGTLDLRRDRLLMTGRFGVDRGFIDLGARETPALDSDVVVQDPSPATGAAGSPAEPPETARAAAPPGSRPSPWLQRSAVALDVDLGRDLRVRGRGVDTPLQGQLKVGAQDGRLTVNGTIDARGGTYAAYGQKLEIDRGRVQFTGAADNPRLDVLALRPKTDMRVGVAILGTAQNPRVRLYSDPEMSERDKLSWLVLGRGAEGLGRTDTTVLQRAALALLSGEQEAPTDAFLRALGIDELTLSQADGDVRETVVGLGKQLGRNWYVGYERGVNATVGTWQLIYRLAQQFTLRARSGPDPSLDLIWTWRFDRPGEWGQALRLQQAPPSDGNGATPSTTAPSNGSSSNATPSNGRPPPAPQRPAG